MRTRSRPRLRILGLFASAALAGGFLSAVPASAAPSRAAAPPATAPSTSVALITGDVVLVGSGDRPAISVLPRVRSGAAGSFRTVRSGSSVRVIPALAVPYLGRELDPALFDVTALAAAHTARLPVRIAFRPGAAPHAVPGVTITSTTGTVATGYLTPGSARRFGQALADQVRADAAAGWHRDTGLFAGISTVGYGGPVVPVAQPRFPMFTLRLRVLDGTGAPAQFASLIVLNVDDQHRFQGFPFVDNGEARISVPAGNYSLLAEIPEFGADGSFSDRFVPVTDFAVTGPVTLPVIDARTARIRPSAAVPRPAVADELELDWVRGDDAGFVFSAGFLYDGLSPVLDAPGRPVRHGELHWGERYHFSAADNSYTYDLRYGADGAIPTRQRHVVAATQLTTLTEHYSSDVPGRQILTVRFGVRAPDYSSFQALWPVTAPSTRTEYVGGSPDVLWQQSLTGVEVFEEDTFVIADIWFDGPRSYRPGQRDTVFWARQPLHPSLDTDTAVGANPFYFCPACRTGDVLGIGVVPLADTEPGHAGFLDQYGDTPIGTITASTRLRVYRGPTLLSDDTDVTGTQLTVPAAAQRYRVLYEQHRTAPWIRLGTAATTEWGFDSGRPAARTAPAGWTCPDGTGDCAVLPLLVPSYEVPTDGLGRVPAGPGTVVVGFAVTQGAPASPVDRATVSWSTDDGRTWTPAAVRSLGGGRWSAAVGNPAGHTVSLRVTGHDRAGATITQTLVRAYAVR
jgi:hypothetical protein